MNRVLWVPVFLSLLAGPLCAAEDALLVPDDCELVASALTLGAARETVDGKLHFRFQVLLKEVVLGRVPEGRTLPVVVGAPLPEGWQEAGRAVVETGEAVRLVFLKAVGEGRKAHFVPVGEGIAAVDRARIRVFIEGLAPRVKQALADLDSEDFETREKAEKFLSRLGYASEEAVREALAGEPSPEVAMRAKRILQGLPRRGTGGRWFIHQPDLNYPDDEIRPLGPGEEITPEFMERLHLTAVNAWAKEYEKAEDKSCVKGFDKYLNDVSKKAGFEDWSDFAMKAAQDLGFEVFSRCFKDNARKQSEIMKKVTERMARAAKEKAAGAEEKKD